MTSTYTTNQGIEKPAAGDQSGTWGGTVNTNMDIIDRAICGVASLTLTGSTTTLTTTDGTLTDGMYRVLILGDGGDLGSDNTITISPNDQSKCYLVYNNLTANRNAIFTQGSGGNITVSNGATAWIYADGAGAGAEVRQGMVSTEIADQDGDTKIQVEEGGDDDDTIRFDIAGAEDFTMTADTFTAAASSIVALDDGAVGAPALTNTGDLNTGVYFPAADTVGVVAGGTEQFRFGSNPIPGGSKNLVQNGAMTVSQRGTGVILAGFDSTTDSYGPDRFMMSGSGSPQNRGEIEHVTTGGPAGFPNFMRYDLTTAESAVAAGELTAIYHKIEAQNLQHLLYGTAGALAVTLQFYMRSPKTGTHCVALYQEDGARSYVREFTVAVADTWEQHSVTFPGDASGTINDDTGSGFRIVWPIIAGSNYQVAADGWAAGADYATSNQQNLADNVANNIDLTGVQMEVGSVATDFAHEDIGTTLNKCQRYFFSTNLFEGQTRYAVGAYDATNGLGSLTHFPTTMRAAPTAAFDSSVFRSAHDGSVFDGTITMSFTDQANGYMANIGTQSSATQGEWYWILDQSGDATTGQITFTAEL